MPGQSAGLSCQGNPSMKVPPKRKGNPAGLFALARLHRSLNESPSEKEGKCGGLLLLLVHLLLPLNESPSEKEGKLISCATSAASSPPQ